MIKQKGFPAELEAIVKDLWSLRLPLIQEKFFESQPGLSADEGDERSGGEAKLYSSQLETDDTAAETEDEDHDVPGGKRKSERTTPSLVDSLALCYMGLMVLRVPVSLGEMYR